MRIDTSTSPKFGNLTLGGGTLAAFDNNVASTAYGETRDGFIGTSLQEAKRISSVEVVSASNGFDASGLTTNITIHLYGKVGSAPTTNVDGVLIGAVSTTDQNVQRVVTLQSNDTITLFDHIWVRLLTGVWSVVAELRLFEAPEPKPDEPLLPLVAGSHVFRKSCNSLIPLVSSGSEVQQFRTTFCLDEPRNILLDFHAAVIHTGVGADAGVAVGYSFWICRRSAKTLTALKAAPFINLPNMFTGDNVSERNPQHYGTLSICDAEVLDAGYHEYSITTNGHTDGSATQGILKLSVEAGMGLNCLRVVVLP